MGINTAPNPSAPVPPPLPRFEFLPPGTDAPRLAWADWLNLLANQLQRDYPGRVGLFLSSNIGALAIQARELGATDPDEHDRLSQEEADRAAAWVCALEAEVAQPGGHWELSDDCNGALDGHPAQPDFEPPDEHSTQYWVGAHDDDVFLN